MKDAEAIHRRYRIRCECNDVPAGPEWSQLNEADRRNWLEVAEHGMAQAVSGQELYYALCDLTSTLRAWGGLDEAEKDAWRELGHFVAGYRNGLRMYS